jgi:uncharacterized LabA/DUF88 family protein
VGEREEADVVAHRLSPRSPPSKITQRFHKKREKSRGMEQRYWKRRNGLQRKQTKTAREKEDRLLARGGKEGKRGKSTRGKVYTDHQTKGRFIPSAQADVEG